MERLLAMTNPELTRRKRVWNWWLHYNNVVFYWAALIVLTIYILINWKICISMQFFQEFNGNNILFLCWLLMIFLKIFKIKVKDVEIFRNLQNDYMMADMKHKIEERQQQMEQEYLPIVDCDEEGESIDAQSAN